MQLTSCQISDNYRYAYELAADLILESTRGKGYEWTREHPDFIELCQSVLGQETVVSLLQIELFDEALYRPVLHIAMREIQQLLLLESQKRGFVSLDAYDFEWLSTDVGVTIEKVETPKAETVMDNLRNHLSIEAMNFLEEKLLRNIADWPLFFPQLGAVKDVTLDDGLVQKIEEQIALLAKFYPQGEVTFIGQTDGSAELDDELTIHAYLNFYLGIEKSFPANFLQRDGDKRSAIVTRFLIDEILETSPQEILAARDETFFIRHKLQNVYRFFNYSCNRVLRNAYADIIPPWLHSRSATDYWETESHRIDAIRWLLESRLGLHPQEFYKHAISKTAFAQNGLSYMFNRYYNSVSRAIAAAYPHLEPWEIGKVPGSYWTDQTAGAAVRWIFAQQGWTVDQAPQLLAERTLNRKTFSVFGLATLFEKRFGKNFFRAIDSAWPGRFEPWEIGKVPTEYWQDRENVYRASRWIAEQEGIAEDEILMAIRSNEFGLKSFRKYPVGNTLKRVIKGRLDQFFAPLFLREQNARIGEYKLLKKVRTLRKGEQGAGVVMGVMNSLLIGEQPNHSEAGQRCYRRLEKRLQRRAASY